MRTWPRKPCLEEGCLTPPKWYGDDWCEEHMPPKICTEEGCQTPPRWRYGGGLGWRCSEHMPPLPDDVARRIADIMGLRRVDMPDGTVRVFTVEQLAAMGYPEETQQAKDRRKQAEDRRKQQAAADAQMYLEYVEERRAYREQQEARRKFPESRESQQRYEERMAFMKRMQEETEDKSTEDKS